MHIRVLKKITIISGCGNEGSGPQLKVKVSMHSPTKEDSHTTLKYYLQIYILSNCPGVEALQVSS